VFNYLDDEWTMSGQLPGQRKKLSGSERRKLKKSEEEKTAHLAKQASIFFKPNVIHSGTKIPQ
jgi:hypothetical protein